MSSRLVRALVAGASLARMAQSKAVFSHYMLGTVSQEHAQQDIDDAMSLGIDAFVLNVGDPTLDMVSDSLEHLFSYAESAGFKLLISMDLYASGASCSGGGTSCNGPDDYKWIWDSYKDSTAYYTVDSKAMISTFSSGGFDADRWSAWKDSLGGNVHFVPDVDDTEGYYDAADAWWTYWGPVVDGVFSWESSWPGSGGDGGSPSAGDVSLDASVMTAAQANGKGYMMGLSPLQYKDAYGSNIYRQGDLALPKRIEGILSMDPQPDWVQVQTWNDGPESHYIASLWPEANSDEEPAKYASQDRWDHSGWQPLIASFADAFRNGDDKSAMRPHGTDALAVGAAWYKTILVDSVSCPNDEKPKGFTDGNNGLHWAVVLSPDAGEGYTAVVGGQTVDLVAGLNYGSTDGPVQTGAQRVQVKDGSGAVVFTATGGMCVSDGCPSGIYNSNYQVLRLTGGDVDAVCESW